MFYYIYSCTSLRLTVRKVNMVLQFHFLKVKHYKCRNFNHIRLRCIQKLELNGKV